jgi:hypothetical protein
MEPEMPVTTKDAVRNAIQFLAEFYPNQADVRLEEVRPYSSWEEELNARETGWVVTISFPDPDQSDIAAAATGKKRLYKDVMIDESGVATRFLIRTL